MSIVLDDVTFRYPDGTPAVDGVSMEVRPGERLAIVGQNGAGKTSTVKLMNGLLRPSSGTVLVDGVDTTTRTTATTARTVAYVFQNPDDQIFGADVRGELEYMPRYLGWSEERTLERVVRGARMAGIGRFLNDNPSDLPLAIKKFVAIGAVLVGEPRYVILDEPTAGLDSRGVALLNRLIGQLEDEGVAVVTITHDMRFVADSFSRVIAMANRKIVADGTAESVFARDEVLKAARLQRPEAAQLVRDLGLSTTALGIGAIASAIP